MDQPRGDAGRGPGLQARVKRLVEWVLALRPVRVFLLYQEHHGAMLADSVTYRTMFSLFAGLFVGFAIAGLWLAGSPDALDALVEALDQAIPGIVGPDGLITPEDLIQPVSLSIAGLIALVGFIGTAIGAINSLRIAMRTIADLPDAQAFFLWRLLGDLAIAAAFGVLLAAGAVLTTFGTTLLGSVFDRLGIGSGEPFARFAIAATPILVTFLLDAVVVAGVIRLLSGLAPRFRHLWVAALLGGFALTVLQVLSGLFVGGASRNPLLASAASLIAILIWLNLSSQVVLLADAWVVTGIREAEDRVAERFGARSMALRRVRLAERRAGLAGAEVQAAREAFAAEEAKARRAAAPGTD
ncbi:YihY/virulence factor BrkB family protein [Agromyces sp. MMS24-JH15]|uniref:YihY/virulence factor BrkB family protein n=1 Tax=Agromyces sp. MMS24-JH15 TaxID=3243765 RepID=UPI003749553B